ncbi:site-specific integrase [Nocardia sp. CY41]|uniref:site-specific integrase n=1 Tax=Nocardia sp. CY41 TaxID=2608686 RepID=UPI001F19829B|nr:site-specific integrase [Nocardia sp. CY41]
MQVQPVWAPGGGPESWTVLDAQLAVIEPVDEFLAHLTAIERAPGTGRSYAFDLRDFFAFLTAHQIDWRAVRLEQFGRFVGWLRLLAGMRSATVTSLPTPEAACSATTINRKLSAAVGSFYTFVNGPYVLSVRVDHSDVPDGSGVAFNGLPEVAPDGWPPDPSTTTRLLIESCESSLNRVLPARSFRDTELLAVRRPGWSGYGPTWTSASIITTAWWWISEATNDFRGAWPTTSPHCSR